MAVQKQYKEGHFIRYGMVMGISIGTALVVPFAVIFDQMAFVGMGPAFGVSIGLAIGAGLEAQAKKEGKIIPLTAEEKEKQKKSSRRFLFALVGGLAVLALGLLLVLFMLMK
jgi:hypothetical protein